MHIQIDNISMHFSDQGSGIPLLLIHGYPLNRRLWEPQLDGLSDVARVIAPDLRGHGDTSPAPAPSIESQEYSMDLLAEDCIKLLDALQITQTVVIGGLSMGGYITLALYRKYPQRIAGLILAATRAAADTPEGKSNREKAVDLARQAGVSAIAQSMIERILSPKTYLTRPDLISKTMEIMQTTSVEGIIGDLLGMKDRLDSIELLSQVHVPTLVIHGADDQLIPLQESQAMQARIPESMFRLIPDAGHLVNLEQPDLFNQAVHEFLQELVQ